MIHKTIMICRKNIFFSLMHGCNKTIKNNVVLIWNISLKNFFKGKLYVVLQKKRCNDYGYSLLDKEMFFFKKSLFTHFEKVVCTRFQGKGDYM